MPLPPFVSWNQLKTVFLLAEDVGDVLQTLEPSQDVELLWTTFNELRVAILERAEAYLYRNIGDANDTLDQRWFLLENFCRERQVRDGLTQLAEAVLSGPSGVGQMGAGTGL